MRIGPVRQDARTLRAALAAALLCGIFGAGRARPLEAERQTPVSGDSGPRPAAAPGVPAVAADVDDAAREGDVAVVIPPTPPTILDPNTRPIDLNTALRLAGVQNPQLLIARQRVVEAAAMRQLAAVQILPSLNFGTNYDSHTGNLQQSNGNILSVNRSALYVGAGSGAVAAGTVSVPGAVLQGNVAVGVFGFLASRQVVAQRQFASEAVRNQSFLATTLAYSELLRAEGKRAVAVQVRDEAKRVAKLTADYANAGQGREADAHRALTELESREADVQAAEGAMLVASARLCNVLNLDPSIRLRPDRRLLVPRPIVPDPMPVCQLIALALLQRPELKERRAAIREALMVLEGSRALPFSPTVLIGFSSGGSGAGATSSGRSSAGSAADPTST